MAALARVPKLRSIRQFAEEEIVVKSGRYPGRLKCHRQPWSGLWLDQIDSGLWTTFALTGGQQGGKTLLGTVVPVMYHLFEVGETVIYAMPSQDMVADKWEEDLLPAIQASRYRELLPLRGQGSRGGTVKTRVTFRNGATLRFMTGGGSDKRRAGFTSRVVVGTEVDGLSVQGEGSAEADKLTQIIGRTTSFGDLARIYLECTVSFEHGRIWQEITQGSDSRIVLPCPHCGEYTTPEREQFLGWQDAGDEETAKANARILCIPCGTLWDDKDRRDANAGAKLLHRGQSIDESGRVAGDPPKTKTLGFRWTAVNNLMWEQSYVAAKEWKAARDPDPDNSDTALRQFFWALPRSSVEKGAENLTAVEITKRVTDDAKGRVPNGAEVLGVGIDNGKWRSHWVALSLREDETPHVVEYGVLEVRSDEYGAEKALTTALREFRDGPCADGWDSDQGRLLPDQVLTDSGWLTEKVYALCRESPGWAPAKGFAAEQYRRPYRQPRKKDKTVAYVGEGYHVVRLQAAGVRLFDCDADRAKSRVHDALILPIGRPGAATLHKADPKDHLTLARHLTAERKKTVYKAGVGEVQIWEALSRNNHFLDAFGLALVAALHALATRPGRESATGKSSWFAKRKRR